MGRDHPYAARVVHEYLEVDEDLVWDVVTGDLEELVRTLKQIVR